MAFGVPLNPQGFSELSGSQTDNSKLESCYDLDDIKEEYIINSVLLLKKKK